MGRGERVHGMEIVLGYPHPQRMDEGLARATSCGWSYQALNIKPDFFPALEFEHSLEDGLDLLGWSSFLDFPLEDCNKKSKEGEAVLWLPGTRRRNCGYHPDEQGRCRKVVGAVRCLCKAGGCAVLGSEIMAVRFHWQILHLCGFLFLLLRALFFLPSSFCFFCCRGKF